MKNTSFERVMGDNNREEVVIHRKKRYGHWKLKILSLILALLLWLIMVNIHEAEHNQKTEPPTPDAQTASCDLTVL